MKTSLKLEHHTIKYTPYILNQNTTSRTLPNNLTLNLTSTQLRTTTPFATQKRSKKSRTNTEIETPTDCLLLFFEWVIKRVSRQLIMSAFFECKSYDKMIEEMSGKRLNLQSVGKNCWSESGVFLKNAGFTIKIGKLKRQNICGEI